MNHNDAKFGTKLTKTIFMRFFRVLLIFTIIFLAIMALIYTGAQVVVRIQTWYPEQPLYRFLLNISNNRYSIIFIGWFIGFFIIFLFFWRKTLGYIKTIADASGFLVSSNEQTIHLPPELEEIESQMNYIKQKASNNAALAKMHEQKKKDLIVYLAHDIKTPLTSIIGYLSLLNEEKDLTKKQRKKYTSITLEKSYKLENLINELFEITRYNTQHNVLEKKEISITLLLEQVLEELYPLTKSQNKEILLHYEKNIIMNVDPNKMARVFNNLIKNALHYSYPFSEIGVEVKLVDTNVQIKIQNKGKQIPEEKLEKIFDKFYRVDEARSSQTGGSGLGLAIVKEIIDLHNGKITATSDKETTVFLVTIPVK